MCAPAAAQKVAPRALLHCTPGTHLKTAPSLHTAPKHIPVPGLTVSVSTQPHPCPAPPYTFVVHFSATPPPPESWQLSGCPCIPVLRQGLLSSWLLQDPGPGFVCPHPNMWCSGGSRGRGSKWLPRWLVASTPLSLSLPLSACHVLLAASGVTEEQGLDSVGTGVGNT